MPCGCEDDVVNLPLTTSRVRVPVRWSWFKTPATVIPGRNVTRGAYPAYSKYRGLSLRCAPGTGTQHNCRLRTHG